MIWALHPTSLPIKRDNAIKESLFRVCVCKVKRELFLKSICEMVDRLDGSFELAQIESIIIMKNRFSMFFLGGL